MAETETVIITGGSDGIGAAAARALSASGRNVVVVGRSAEKIASGGRVIASSSIANLSGRILLNGLGLQTGYTPGRAYSNAKLANILFSSELARRFGPSGVTAASFHPGVVAFNFASETTSPLHLVYRGMLGRTLTTPERGADTLLWLATSVPGQNWVSGQYYVKRKLGRSNRLATDPQLAAGLWEQSFALTAAPLSDSLL